MKFLVTSDLRRNAYLRWLLVLYFLMLLVFIGISFAYEAFRFGLTPESVRNSVLGNPDLFIDPLDLVTLITELHVHLFLYSLALLTTFSVFVNLPIRNSFKLGLTAVLTTCALFDSLSLLGIRYLWAELVWLKVLSFWTLQILLAMVILVLLGWLVRRPSATAR